MIRLFLSLALLFAVPAHAEIIVPDPKAERTILFVGNSFTFGAGSPVRRYRVDSVTDLNGDGVGGVPALFKRFTEQAGLDYAVSLETSPGKDLAWHHANRSEVFSRRWDAVVLQGHSVLDPARPGDPARHIASASALAALATRANAKVDVQLVSTWSRADLTYRPGSRWSGMPIAAMAADLRTASNRARAASKDIDGVVPVGEAFTRAMTRGVADPDPYDGIAYGQVDLWTHDHYHGSTYGYYLEALMVFGRVTGIDPRTLGAGEKAADDLGMSPAVTKALQDVAWEQLQAG